MTLHCPACATALAPAVERTPAGRIELDYCQACRGVWFDDGELVALLGIGDRRLVDADPASCRPARGCPRHPETRMLEGPLRFAGRAPVAGAVKVERCPDCRGVWLDGGELQGAAADARASVTGDEHVPPEEQRLHSRSLWVFQFLTGLPVEQWNPRERRPLVVVGLIALCIAAFVAEIGAGAQEVVMRLGLVPSRLVEAGGLTLVTSTFLHGGPGHLAGNMYFLWTFGDNVEDRLGRVRFLVAYLVSGVAAGLVHVAFNQAPDMPVVGASGAIAGVMAAYAVLFPRTRLISLVLFWRVRWPAWAYLGFWLFIQVVGVVTGTGQIAWWAHIGGFVAGGLIALFLRHRPVTRDPAR